MAKRKPSPAGHLPLDYYANISLPERRVLQVLHAQLGQVLPRVETIAPRTFGFQVEAGHITGIGLYGKNLEQLLGTNATRGTPAPTRCRGGFLLELRGCEMGRVRAGNPRGF